MAKVAAVFIIVFFASACTMNARLYPLSGGGVLPAEFSYSGSGRGDIRLVLPGNNACSGEYVTVAGGSTSWGSIFASASGPAGYATASGTTRSVNIPNMQEGSAAMTCSDGRTLECEYVTSSWSVRGYGMCRDSTGALYKLMF